MIDEILKQDIIIRKNYINNLNKYLDSNVIKVLTWMRRVWKSYILKTLIRELYNSQKINKKNFFYINKEDLEYDNIKDYNDLNKEFKKFLENTTNWKIFVWIDEIQEIHDWERFINSILSVYQNNIEIFITWSNSNLLSSELSTLLTWRYIEFEIFPLCLEEYSLFSWEKISKELFMEYLKYGWLPWRFFMNKEDVVIFNYLKWIYSTIVLKDIVKYFWLRNIDFFENLYKYVFSNIWHVFSAKSISDYLKSQRVNISPETVLNYLDYWLKVYLLNLVKAENPITKKYFEIYNKYYVWDLWLRNAISGFNLSRDIWNLLENYAYLEFRRMWYEIKIWRLKDNEEVDFIIEKNGITKYFQISYLLSSEDTINREFWSLEKISDSWEKYVVTMDDVNFWVRNWIKHINVLNLNSVL